MATPTTTITPYLCCKDAAAAIDFYKKALGAVEVYRLSMPDGKIGHAELSINGASFMLSEENPQWGNISPTTLKGTGVTLYVVLPDVDAAFARALAAGATVLMPLQNTFYGHRAGSITDPYGHRWSLATVVEQLTGEQVSQRAAKMFGAGDCGGAPKK